MRNSGGVLSSAAAGRKVYSSCKELIGLIPSRFAGRVNERSEFLYYPALSAQGTIFCYNVVMTTLYRPIVRFPPSPTGLLHIGGARTALFNYLFAKKYGGKILLRIEDTDTDRSKEDYEKNILDSLNWLGLKFDNAEPVHQRDRGEIYKKYLKQIVDAGLAYISEEAKSDEPKRRGQVIRFKNPNKKIGFNDLIRGEIEFDTADLGDFVIAKSPSEPLYHLAVVIDDFEMGITHVIRGEDHISNTPRQILIQEAIGASRPEYAHIPLILAKDRSKLSKRHGAVSVTEYQERGYLKEALINYLALLGWNPGTNQELFSTDELVSAFSLEKIQKGGAIFDEEKLKWFNREYIKRLPRDIIERELEARVPDISRPIICRAAPYIVERISVWQDLEELNRMGEFDFYKRRPKVSLEQSRWKNVSIEKTANHLSALQKLITDIPEGQFSKEAIKTAVWSYAEANGRGEVLWPMRFILSGKDRSPDPFTIAEIIGKQETIGRLGMATSL